MKVVRGCLAWILAAGLCGSALGAAAAQVKLRYRPTTSLRRTGAVRTVTLEGKRAPAQPLKGQPKYASERVLFFELKLGPEQTAFALALDESRGTDTGYDRLYVDANADGDLSDEQPIQGMFVSGDLRGTCLFLDVALSVDYGGGKATWHCDAYAHLVRASDIDAERTVLAIRPRGRYEGELALNGKKRKIALVDADCTGRFNDPPQLPKEGSEKKGQPSGGDRVLVDLNGDGRFDASREAFACTKYLTLDGGRFLLTVAPNGQTLTLSEATVATGSLARHGGGTFSLTLLSPEHGEVKLSSKGEPAKLPAGKYTIRQCSVEIKSLTGGTWEATAEGASDGKVIEIAKDKVTTAKFGPPLRLGATVSVMPDGKLSAVKPGDTLVMEPKITGQAGEVYELSALSDDGGIPEPPSVTIRNAKGEVVTQADFQYG